MMALLTQSGGAECLPSSLDGIDIAKERGIVQNIVLLFAMIGLMTVLHLRWRLHTFLRSGSGGAPGRTAQSKHE